MQNNESIMQTGSNTPNDDNTPYIIDAELPDAVNFNHLKKSGIEQLQKSVGKVWSNYNESDPGVTILDQLCYALTELGYCSQFPVADVLTDQDGKIRYHDQFFEPQEILTTSPVTIDDYRRLVHDNMKEVRVVYIVPEKTSLTGVISSNPEVKIDTSQPIHVTGRYQTYLSLQKNVNVRGRDTILERAYVLLNQHRNIAEFFLPPLALSPRVITLLGRVLLSPGADAAQVQSRLLEVLENYAAPLPVRSGYQELLSEGITADQIFNGPQMHHGWIYGSSALGQKCNSVSLFQLSKLIATIPGMFHVETLSFSPASLAVSDDAASIAIAADALAVIKLDPTFKIVQNEVAISPAAAKAAKNEQYFRAMQRRHQASSIEANVEAYPVLQGNYRDIEKYYSVQNTFPDQYCIGLNSPNADALPSKIACSRQLKGYLMPFDQLLANQFSQLAHVGELFSFHSRKVVSKESHQFKHQLKLSPVPVGVTGIPYKGFSTTYFCQPLYQIADVKPLLVGHDAFRYQFAGSGTDNLIEQAEWNAYKKFPFNQYQYGMQQGMESDFEANTRRDIMLNHLMARHGDDAKRYDEVIKTSQWIGNEIKTRIIVKSIWLQNFQKLSYHRTRAFDCLSPTTLLGPEESLTPEKSLTPANHNMMYPIIDGEPDQASIYADARLHENNFMNFSAFELKAGILLGLPKYFLGLTCKLNDLLANADFALWVASPAVDRARYHLPESDISVVCGGHMNNADRVKKDQLFDGQKCLLDIVWANGAPPGLADYHAHAEQLEWLATRRQGMLLIEPILLLPVTPLNDPRTLDYFLTAYLLLPRYVRLIQKSGFQQCLAMLQELHCPAHVTLQYLPSSFSMLESFIQNFMGWNKSDDKPRKANGFSVELATLLKLPALHE